MKIQIRLFTLFAIASGFITEAVAQTYMFSTLAGTSGVHGDVDGSGRAAQFINPSGIAVDGAGNVYVLDYDASGNFGDVANLRKMTANGVVTTFATGIPAEPPDQIASTANSSPACSKRSASRAHSETTTTRVGRTARSTIARRRIIAPNFCAKLPTPVRPAKPGLPSVGSLPLFPTPTTPSGVTNNPLGFLSQVVQ